MLCRGIKKGYRVGSSIGGDLTMHRASGIGCVHTASFCGFRVLTLLDFKVRFQ